MMRVPLAVVGLLGVALSVTGCASAASVGEATPGCNSAFETASSAMNTHYKTHPFFGEPYDALYADGTISDAEQVELDALMEDEQAKFAALVDPTYDACSSVEDLYRGAFAHRDIADWALLDVESMSREEIKAIFVTSHCHGNETRPACSDFDPEEWR